MPDKLEELKIELDKVENDILRCKSGKSIKSLRLLTHQIRKLIAIEKRDILRGTTSKTVCSVGES